MRTVRRRAADPTLRWDAAGRDRQYRVAARNEDTGARRTIYEGFRRDCRLPADLRLSPDQITFRVESRPGDDPGAPYVRCQEFTVIPRIGDELSPDAEDVLSAPLVPGAESYRLQIRDILSRDVVVDMASGRPRFLLPAGQMIDRQAEWAILAYVGGRWRKSHWKPVTPASVAAAQARAQTLITLVEPKRVRPGLESASHPASIRSALVEAPAHPQSVAIVVPVTARPALAPEPTADSVTNTQWSDGQGGGAVERAAAALEAEGLTGWFFLDVEQGLALGLDAMGRLADRLRGAGHHVGLYIGAGELGPRSGPAERLARMMEGLDRIGVADKGGVMVGDAKACAEWLDCLVEAGFSSVILSRPAQLGLTGWRRWRTAPFLTGPTTVVLPLGMFISTPAHARDRSVRHPIANEDALAGGSAGAMLEAVTAFCEDQTLTLAMIDPLLLLARRTIRDRIAANVWNTTIKNTYRAWVKAGWTRSAKGFEVGQGESEIQRDLLQGMLRGLAQSATPQAAWDDVFDPARVSGWLRPGPAFEPLIEQRRGPRRFRASAVRRYDNSYRLALKVQP